jgi:hypothetical protein
MTHTALGEPRRARTAVTFPSKQAGGRTAHPKSRHLRRRLAAFIVDSGLLVILIFLGAAALGGLLGSTIAFGAGDGDILYDARLARATAFEGIATGCVYYCASWPLFGATPGQRLLGLAVRVGDGLAPLTPARALARWLVLGAPLWIATSMVPGWMGVAAAIAMGLWGVCLLVSTIRSATGRGLHDLLSGTRVVRIARAAGPRDVEARDVR